MREVGEVLHVAGSGRVIIKLSRSVNENQILYNRRGTKIAKVLEIIGPIARPYASAMHLTNNTRNIVGRRLFAPEAGGSAR